MLLKQNSLMSPLCLFRITAERTVTITLLSLQCSGYESALQMNHDWTTTESAECVLDMVCHDSVLVKMTQVFSAGLPTLHREERFVEQCSVWTPATLCCPETYPAFCQRLLHSGQRTERTKNPTTNACCGPTLLMDTPPGLCQPLLQAAASAICGVALALLLSVGKRATLQGMHGFDEMFSHHAPFWINCFFLLYSECHFSMPRMPKF